MKSGTAVSHQKSFVRDPPPSPGLTINALPASELISILCRISRHSLDGRADLLTAVAHLKALKPQELCKGDRLLINSWARHQGREKHES